jgi:ATP-dependent DNA helicase RecQ
VLKGETTLMLRRQAPRVRGTKKRAAPMPLLPQGGDALFDALRQWRAATAREQGVPAYVILHDRTLHELATLRPQTADELLTVAGIGAAKAERYGAALLAALRDADEINAAVSAS